MADDEALGLLAAAAALPPPVLLDVFVASWFPPLRALPTPRLLGHLIAPSSFASAMSDILTMEIAQRYASVPASRFRAEVPDAAVRRRVRAWWRATFERRPARTGLGSTTLPKEAREKAAMDRKRAVLAAAAAADTGASDDAAEDALTAALLDAAAYQPDDMAARHAEEASETTREYWQSDQPVLTFGYDAEAPVPSRDERFYPDDTTYEFVAATRGDLVRMLRASEALDFTPPAAYLKRPGPHATLLERLVWAGLERTAAQAFGWLGHTSLVEQLLAETVAAVHTPSMGTVRQRARMAYRGAVLLTEVAIVALQAGRAELADRIVASGIVLSTSPSLGELLAGAVESGHALLVQRLLALRPADADPRELRTPVCAALQNNRPEILTLLLEAGASGWSPLIEYIRFAPTYKGAVTPACMAAIIARDGWGAATLEKLLNYLDLDGLRWALEHGVPLVDRAGEALCMVVQGRYPLLEVLPTVRFLLDAGFPVSKDAVSLAAAAGDIETFLYLVDKLGAVPLPVDFILEDMAERYELRNLEPMVRLLHSRWGVRLDAPTVLALASKAFQAATVAATIELDPTLATPEMMEVALKGHSVALVQVLWRRGVPLPGDFRKHNYITKELFTYLHGRRCPGWETITEAEREVVDAAAPEGSGGATGGERHSSQAGSDDDDDASNNSQLRLPWGRRVVHAVEDKPPSAEALAARAILRTMEDRLPALFAPAIGFFRPARAVDPLAIAVGATHQGGLPDLPPDLVWPVSATGVPMAFLLQVNLADAASAEPDVTALHPSPLPAAGRDNTALLPTQGWLWLFIDVDAGMNDAGTFATALLHWTGPAERLQRTRHPNDAALEDADLAELGTGFGAFPLTPRRTVTPDPLDPSPAGFSRAERDAVYTAWSYPGNDRAGVVEEGPRQAQCGLGALARYTLGPDHAASWLARSRGLQLCGHPDLVQSDVFAYIPEDTVRRHAAGEAGAPPVEEDEAGADANDELDLADEEEEEGGRPAGGAFGEVAKTMRLHNARIARRAGARVLRERRAQWMLLAQIPAVSSVRYYGGTESDTGVIHGKVVEQDLDLSGRGNAVIYVCIRRADLVARRFDKHYTVFQFS